MAFLSTHRLSLLALLGGAAGIGMAPILVRYSSVGPSTTAFYRLLFALPFLWWWLQRETFPASGAAPPRPVHFRDYPSLALAGLLFVGDLALWHWSLQLTSVANSTLLANLAPVFATLGARFFLGERLSMLFLIGLATAVFGGVLLVQGDLNLDQGRHLGHILAVAAAVFYAAYLLHVKRLRSRFSSLTIMAWSGLVACPGFFLLGLISQETLLPLTLGAWGTLLALGLVSHLGGQTLIAFSLGQLPASYASVGLLLQPVIATGLAWILFQEPLGFVQGIGAAIILLGIALATRGTLRAGKRPPA
jgi:drug/metabolite transporter (DMT)-like permease